MSRYDLHVESGPKRRKTYVHVPALLGCGVLGPTTDDAVAAAPDEIRAFAAFLTRHGEDVDAGDPVEVRVVEHSMEGEMVGQGGARLSWDERTLSGPAVRLAARRWRWLRDELIRLLRGVDEAQLAATPPTGERPLERIAAHVLGGAGSYLSPVFGGTPEVGRLYRLVEKQELRPVDALAEQAPLLDARLDRLANVRGRAELRRPERITRGIRRLLEHEWEHLREVERRLGE